MEPSLTSKAESLSNTAACGGASFLILLHNLYSAKHHMYY